MDLVLPPNPGSFQNLRCPLCEAPGTANMSTLRHSLALVSLSVKGHQASIALGDFPVLTFPECQFSLSF